MAAWELAAQRDPSFPVVFRNLGIARFNKAGNPEKALSCYEKAFSLDPTDARVLMELDQLYKRLNKDPRQRLEFLEEHLSVVELRDDLYLERIALYNFMGKHDEAYKLIMDRKFHPWEGGEGKVSGQYVYSLVAMARQNLQSGQYQKAIELLEQAQTYPPNLGEGKLYGMQENDIFYWMAYACKESGNKEEAKAFFNKSTQGLSVPAAAMFYNDQQPDKIFYQGLSWIGLGETQKAEQIFSNLIEYGKAHLDDEMKIDYFAVSLPDLMIFEDDLDLRNQVHCYYMIGLGWLGLNNGDKAAKFLNKVLSKDAMHHGAKMHLGIINDLCTAKT